MTDEYTCHITRSAENGEHVGLCAKFPSLGWLAPAPGEAPVGIRGVVRECVAGMRTSGEAPPEPVATGVHGRSFIVRVSPETRRDLAIQAAEQAFGTDALVHARLGEQARHGFQANPGRCPRRRCGRLHSMHRGGPPVQHVRSVAGTSVPRWRHRVGTPTPGPEGRSRSRSRIDGCTTQS